MLFHIYIRCAIQNTFQNTGPCRDRSKRQKLQVRKMRDILEKVPDRVRQAIFYTKVCDALKNDEKLFLHFAIQRIQDAFLAYCAKNLLQDCIFY